MTGTNSEESTGVVTMAGVVRAEWVARLRAVAFDLDNTLWQVEPVIARAETRMHAFLAERCPALAQAMSIEDLRAARDRLARSEPEHAHDFTWLRLTSLRSLAVAHGYDAALGDAAFEVFFAARNEVELFADVGQALGRLRGRFALASLSNGNADLARIGLDNLFRVSLNARAIGVGKPHPRCFERLAEQLGVAPAAILYVGDDPWLDVHAARAVGCATAWMNRDGHDWPADLAPADLAVADCGELADRLGA